jgi:phage baseplate assembly protein V
MSDHNGTNIRQIWNRVLSMIGRGRTTAGPNDAGSVQMLQLTLGPLETRDGTPRVAEFGFTSAPPVGSDAVLVFLGGNRKTGIVIATGHQQTRPTGLNAGESQIYDAFGKSIYLTEDNGIVINANGAPVTVNDATTVTINAISEIVMNTPTLQVNGDIVATGNVSDGKRSMAADRAIYNEHGHSPNSTSQPSPQQ